MSNKQPEPTPPKSGGLWARLFGMSSPAKPEPAQEAPAALPESVDDEATLAVPASESTAPQRVPLEEPAASDLEPAAAVAVPADAFAAAMVQEHPGRDDGATLPELELTPPEPCPACGTLRKGAQAFCDDCGWLFNHGPVKSVATVAALLPTAANGASSPAADSKLSTVPAMRLKDRYEVVQQLSERGNIVRFSGLDHSSAPPRAVVIVRAPVQQLPEAVLQPGDDTIAEQSEEIMPTFEDTLPVAQYMSQTQPTWPGITWEQWLLVRLDHPSLPKVVECFVDNDSEYLVEEQPAGQVLWDAWDDPSVDSSTRYGWLKQVAQLLHSLHTAGAVCESLRPDIITITGEGQAVLNDLGELVAIPVPPGTQIRASLYTAPELVLTPEKADGRADLYGFGAMLYALEYLHHALEEKDFERQFSPKLITDRYPDVHPGFFRLVSKTFNRDVHSRFPTDEAVREDKTGIVELIRTLDVCRRTFDTVRLDIAAWTTTGMVRSGNEDAFSFLHGMESRQDELTEYAMVLLCDGMGGYEAGEVAAAMCLASMRKYLLQQPIFSALAGGEPPLAGVFSVDIAKKVLLAALKHANKEVFMAARTPGKGKRGMGCTAECVYVDNRHVIVGHVGDSRTYHLHEGRLVQLTRDQTLVNRLVELGQLTPEEAENHPRKNELQQAIGGQPEVEPGVYDGRLQRGDWVLVCSDGLTNHIPAADLTMMLAREAMSAEDAARRLMNLVNLRGATDNATIVVIRAT
jgi:protein phosphatase